MNSKNVPCTSTLDDNKNIFTFDHIGFGKEGDVGWTRIMKNNEIKDSLGFYTRHIDPILTSLTENTLIGSAWQWPKDSKLNNGPFFNYHLDFNTRKTEELPTRGKLIIISNDGTKAVFLESECVKNPDSLKLGTECNDKNLSLRTIELPLK
ncbi:MAG: hypothetical protein L3J07_02565 [Candidatus Magasanikbacteria bacterium]|nr:hypothetical protein [Candidatus Magasanikbacteria bacterium]